MDKLRLRLAVLISGTGRTLANLLRASKENNLLATVELVIASRNCQGLCFADKEGIPYYILEGKDFSDKAEYSSAIFARCEQFRIDYVCLGGWLKRLVIPKSYENRVINIHPSLLPSFGGQGMYGKHVHQAVLNEGCKLAGCTVHFVDQDYDHGPILHQASTYVTDDDTVETLAERVFQLECVVYPMTIRNLAQYRVEIVGQRRVVFRERLT